MVSEAPKRPLIHLTSGTLIPDSKLKVSAGIAETTRFGSDIDPAETEAETNVFGFREMRQVTGSSSLR
jgi:hypothetical protein